MKQLSMTDIYIHKWIYEHHGENSLERGAFYPICGAIGPSPWDKKLLTHP